MDFELESLDFLQRFRKRRATFITVLARKASAWMFFPPFFTRRNPPESTTKPPK